VIIAVTTSAGPNEDTWISSRVTHDVMFFTRTRDDVEDKTKDARHRRSAFDDTKFPLKKRFFC
jgi:hypothetical protein